MKLSLSEQLILSILAEQSRHGYDVEKVIHERGMRKWTDIGFSSIYYILEKLETKGLATSTETRGKEKKQYSITKNGMVALGKEAAYLITERKPANTHFMTGLASSQFIEASKFVESLEQRKVTLMSDLQAVRSKLSATENLPKPARQLFSLSEALLKAELVWINEQLKREDK